jgi:hypothetical protein
VAAEEDHVAARAGQDADHVRHREPPVWRGRLEGHHAHVDPGSAQLRLDVGSRARARRRAGGARADRHEALDMPERGRAIEGTPRVGARPDAACAGRDDATREGGDHGGQDEAAGADHAARGFTPMAP